MAFVRCRKSLSMVKQCLVLSSSGKFSPFLYRNSTLTSFPSPNLSSFLSKLMQQPLSSVKATLDSEDKCFSSSVFKSQDFSWDALVIALKSSYPKKANLVVEWRLEKFMKENEKNHDSYSGLISLCGAIQNVETALCVFSSMEAQGLKPNSSVFNVLMESSEEYKSNADTYNAFILAYANLGNKNSMQAWYLAKMTTGFLSDFQTCESLILGCVKSKDFCDGENFLEEMTLTGFIPSSSIMQNMLVVYSQKINVTKIKEYLKYAMDGSWSISEDTLVNVMGLFNELGGVKDMEELLVTLTNSNQPSEILSLVHS